MARPSNATEAWSALAAGNNNFVNGTPAHPRQDAELRRDLASEQKPFAALFGCSDSRLAAEMIFDVGLGDLFVVRNAGQIIAETIVGSLEFSVEVLNVPLILVLGHDSCGAVKATLDSTTTPLASEGSFIPHLVRRILPTVEAALEEGVRDLDQITSRHVNDTISELMERSDLIRSRVESGRLGVVGAQYRLEEGLVEPIAALGLSI